MRNAPTLLADGQTAVLLALILLAATASAAIAVIHLIDGRRRWARLDRALAATMGTIRPGPDLGSLPAASQIVPLDYFDFTPVAASGKTDGSV